MKQVKNTTSLLSRRWLHIGEMDSDKKYSEQRAGDQRFIPHLFVLYYSKLVSSHEDKMSFSGPSCNSILLTLKPFHDANKHRNRVTFVTFLATNKSHR